jgi:hypothetical protein
MKKFQVMVVKMRKGAGSVAKHLAKGWGLADN